MSQSEEIKQIIEIYIAIYKPSGGFYYHWALGVYNAATDKWTTHEATRAYPSGPFVVNSQQIDPRSTAGCIKPMTVLATVPSSNANAIRTAVNSVQPPQVKPGEHSCWDCQDFVQEAVRGLISLDVVLEAQGVEAWEVLRRYHGKMAQDFATSIMPPEGEQRVLSDEYVYDSDDGLEVRF